MGHKDFDYAHHFVHNFYWQLNLPLTERFSPCSLFRTTKADVDCWLYANTLVRQERFLRNSRARPFLYFYVTGTSPCPPASNQRQTGSQLGSPLGSSWDESLVVGLGADS